MDNKAKVINRKASSFEDCIIYRSCGRLTCGENAGKYPALAVLHRPPRQQIVF